jgi:hypothetical protein
VPPPAIIGLTAVASSRRNRAWLPCQGAGTAGPASRDAGLEHAPACIPFIRRVAKFPPPFLIVKKFVTVCVGRGQALSNLLE